MVIIIIATICVSIEYTNYLQKTCMMYSLVYTKLSLVYCLKEGVGKWKLSLVYCLKEGVGKWLAQEIQMLSFMKLEVSPPQYPHPSISFAYI